MKRTPTVQYPQDSSDRPSNNTSHHALKLVVPCKTEWIFLSVDELSYCISDGGYTELILSDGTRHLTPRSLKAIEKVLLPYGFIRVHAKYLVSLFSIKSYIKTNGNVKMLDNVEITVSRARRQELQEAVKSHFITL